MDIFRHILIYKVIWRDYVEHGHGHGHGGHSHGHGHEHSSDIENVNGHHHHHGGGHLNMKGVSTLSIQKMK